MRFILSILLLTFATWARADDVAMAAADARRLPAEARQYARYLSLANVLASERGAMWKILSYHCNSLSTSADVVVPSIVPGTQSALLRLDIRDYDWATSTWEKLAELDPYYHAKIAARTVIKTWPGGIWPNDGRYYPPGSFTYEPKVQKQLALAPWLNTQAAADLVNLTQSASPIVRGDWFLWQTAVNADRGGAGYYAFLGVKSKKDFERLAGYSKDLARSAKIVELHEAVADSTVTLQPRRIEVDRALSGHFYTTFDSRQAVDGKNPLRNLNGLSFDATEFFCHLANGGFAWGVANAKGELQDTAPDNIASDGFAHSSDRRVHAGLSCLRCHGPNGGVQPVDGWVRGLLRDGFTVQSPEYEKAKELRQRYLRDLDGPLEDGRRLYGRMVAEATGGMKVADLAVAYGEAFARYDAPVSLERAAADRRMTPTQLTQALESYRKTTGGLDLVIAGFLSKRKGGVPIRQYHESFSTLATITRGYAP